MNLDQKLASLQEISKVCLSKLLNSSAGPKNLVLDPQVIRPLEKVCGVKWLKENGVEKIFKLDNQTSCNGPNIFYLIYGNWKAFRLVLDQIRAGIDLDQPSRTKYNLIVVPRSLFAFEKELEEFGLLGNVKTHSFQWLPINLDEGVLSLEIPQVFKEVFVHQDWTLLPSLSQPLWQLSLIVGRPRFLMGIGQVSLQILRQLDNLFQEKGDSDRIDCDFAGVILLDRTVDYPSALLTPGTYSGLLNEVYEGRVGFVEQPEEILTKTDRKSNVILSKLPLTLCLDSRQDDVYADIKYRYFTEVTSVLSNLTKQLRTEQTQSKDMALDEIKHYVQTKLQQTKLRKKLISNHLQAAETIINNLGSRYESQSVIEQNILQNREKTTNYSYLDQLLNNSSKETSLRLFSLISLTQKLSEQEVKTFTRKFLQHFGYENSYLISNLTQAQILTSNSTSKFLFKTGNKNFYNTTKQLKLIPASLTSLKNPTCPSYVFSGTYIPLITKICSLLLNATPLDEVRTKLELLAPIKIQQNHAYPLQSRTLLIYLIGGATYAELAACDLLQNILGSKIIILTDQITTGNDLMKGLVN